MKTGRLKKLILSYMRIHEEDIKGGGFLVRLGFLVFVGFLCVCFVLCVVFPTSCCFWYFG